MTRKTLNTAILIFVSIALLWPLGAAWPAAAPSPELQAVLQSSGADEEIPVIVTLPDGVNLDLFTSADKDVRRGHLVQALKDQAELQLKPLIDLLQSRGVSDIHSLWIINGLALRASPAVIQELAARPEVESVQLDRVLVVPPGTLGAPDAPPEWNISAINAPDLWNLGYTGQGVVVANMDSGVDLNHPDLKDKWRGGKNSWFDPVNNTTVPYDKLGHGTQTMGIMVGGSAGGTAIGVAPGAQWIAAKVFDDSGNALASNIHKGFQWLLNPDGKPGTHDAPDVVNNSWAWLNPANPCDTEFKKDIRALRHAGIAVVFAGGNYGPDPSTSVPPANNPRSFSVGATDNGSVIADFSSRGPSSCDGSIYPNVVAPGVNVTTADLTNGGLNPDPYCVVSGTSFSGPHAAGAIALLLSAFPRSTVAHLESILEKSAVDLGTQGPDNTYGNGLLDVGNAHAMLYAGRTPPVAADHTYGMRSRRKLAVASPGVLRHHKGKRHLEAMLVTGVSNGSLVFRSNGSFTYRPSPGFTGTDEFTYQASNGELSNVATVTIRVKTSSSRVGFTSQRQPVALISSICQVNV